jgi:hypothetical protein
MSVGIEGPAANMAGCGAKAVVMVDDQDNCGTTFGVVDMVEYIKAGGRV